MKSNKLNINLRRVAAMCLASAFATVSAFAQQINAGVDMTELFTPNNFIYYGWYNHAKSLSGNDRGAVATRDGAQTPIVWRIMGQEAGVDNYITLMSEYVIDSQPYGSTGQMWNTSTLRNWLNGSGGTDFPSSFSATEIGEVQTASVWSPSYDNGASMSYVSGSSPSSSSSDKFYIPWGTPNQSGPTATKNKVFWTVGDSGGALPGQAGKVDSSLVRAIGLKDKQSNPQYNVYYWLRPMVSGVNGDVFLLVKSDNLGPIDIAGIGESMGVRPIFKLDTAKILFAAEVMSKNSVTRLDQMSVLPNDDYKDEDQMPNGGSGGTMKAYKLTLQSTSYALSANFIYDLDDTVATVTDTVALKPGEKLGFKLDTPPTSGSPDGLAQKIVSGWNSMEYYNYTGRTDSLFVTADNIYTTTIVGPGGTTLPNPAYGSLDIGTYTTYVWAQKNVALQSNEGSTPQAFTTRVLNDNTAPALSAPTAIRLSTGEATVTFTINESNLGGKFYYITDPASAPTSFDTDYAPGIISSALTKTPFTLSSATGTVTFTTQPLANPTTDPHIIYIIAKDLVRNVSNILPVNIPVYEPPVNPQLKSPPAEAILYVGETVTFTGDSLADDANVLTGTDFLTITSPVVTPPNTAIATATISGGVLSIYGVTSGITSVTVTVVDNYPGTTPLTVTVPITVKETPPNVSIDYVEEDLVGFLTGASYSINGGSAIVPGTFLDEIPEEWFDTTISIVKVSAANPALNSPPQLLYIPPRPDPPTVNTVSESLVDFHDGQLIDMNDSIQYRAVGETTWSYVHPYRTFVDGLASGDYEVRYRAIANTQFASQYVVVTIEPGLPRPSIVRSVYLPSVTGTTITPAPGLYYVESSSSFTFTVKFAREPLSLRTNRILDGATEYLTGVLQPDGSYQYVIQSITSTTPIVIYFGDFDGVEAVSGAQSVWSSDGRIYIESSRSATVAVYSINGRLVKKVNAPEGLISIDVANGVYIVVSNGETPHKVAVGY